MKPSEATASSPNLYDLPPAQFEAVVGEVVSPPFRVKQIREWLYHKGAGSFEVMTNLPAVLRQELSERFDVGLPEVRERTAPAEDGSQKFLFTLRDGKIFRKDSYRKNRTP